MLVSQRWGSYSSSLYSTPWICKIIRWDIIDKNPEKVLWGRFQGACNIGGTVSMLSEVNDIIKTGQKEISSGFSNTCYYKVIEEEKTPFGNHLFKISKEDAWTLFKNQEAQKNIVPGIWNPLPTGKIKSLSVENTKQENRIVLPSIPIEIGSNLELEMKDCLKEFSLIMDTIEKDGWNNSSGLNFSSLYIRVKTILEKTEKKKYLTRAIEI